MRGKSWREKGKGKDEEEGKEKKEREKNKKGKSRERRRGRRPSAHPCKLVLEGRSGHTMGIKGPCGDGSRPQRQCFIVVVSATKWLKVIRTSYP